MEYMYTEYKLLKIIYQYICMRISKGNRGQVNGRMVSDFIFTGTRQWQNGEQIIVIWSSSLNAPKRHSFLFGLHSCARVYTPFWQLTHTVRWIHITCNDVPSLVEMWRKCRYVSETREKQPCRLSWPTHPGDRTLEAAAENQRSTDWGNRTACLKTLKRQLYICVNMLLGHKHFSRSFVIFNQTAMNILPDTLVYTQMQPAH